MTQTSASSVVSPSQMAAALRRVGFPITTIPVMIAIGLAESGGRIDATNTNRDGSIDRGVWQINSVHGFDAATLMTLDGNASAAKVVYDKQGLKAWATFNSGSYKKFLSEGQRGADTPDATDTGSPVASGVQGFGNPLGGVSDAFSWLGTVGGYLTSGDFWKRTGLIVLGLALGIVGLTLFVKSEAVGTVRKAVSI